MSQQINLFSPMFRRQRFSLLSADAMLYGVLAVIAATAAYAVYANYRLRTIEREAQTVADEYQTLTARRDALTAAQAVRQPDARLAAEVANLESDLTMRRAIIDMLKSGALGTTMGYSEYMRAFSRKATKGLWLTGFDIAAAGSQLTLMGRTLSPDLLPEYLRQLNQEPVLQGRQFAAMLISRPQPATPPGGAAPASVMGVAINPPVADAAAAAPAPAVVVTPRYLDFTITTADAVAANTAKAAP